MKPLSEKELKEIQGGWSITSTFGIGALITFLLGVIDGYLRPFECR